MPRTALPGGIGAVGSAMARFFHPSKKIRDQWPNDDKRRLTAVLVTGEATRAVRHKQQLCYLVRIQEIDDGTEFYIAKRNFNIMSPPLLPSRARSLKQQLCRPSLTTRGSGSPLTM